MAVESNRVRGMWPLWACACVVTLTTPLGAGWEQLGGEPERAGLLDFAPAVMGIVGISRQPWAQDTFPSMWLGEITNRATPLPLGPNLQAAGEDVWGLFFPDGDTSAGSCDLMSFTPGSADVVALHPLDGTCRDKEIGGFLESRGWLLICDQGAGWTEPLVSAVELATGEVVWTVSPSDVSDQASSQQTDHRWGCSPAAIDPSAQVGTFLVANRAYVDYHSAYIAAIDLVTGALRSVVSADAPGGDSLAPPNDRILSTPCGHLAHRADAAGVARRLQPGAIAVIRTPGNTSGFVATGVFQHPQPPCANTDDWGEFGAIWTGPGGTGTGGYVTASSVGARDGVLAEANPWFGLAQASARDGMAALVVGGHVLVVNPSTEQPILAQRINGIEEPQGVLPWAPLWWKDQLIVPMEHSVASVRRADLSPSWTWAESLAHRVADVLPTASGHLVVLLVERAYEEPPYSVFAARVDASSGRTVELLRLPPFEKSARVPDHWIQNGWWEPPVRLVPLPNERLLVVYETGTQVVLAEGRSGASLARVSDAYPAPGEPIKVTLRRASPDATGVTVTWGDGARDEGGPEDAFRHIYSQPGDVAAVVTMQSPDGTTVGDRFTIHVGGAPPPELTPIQAAFAPENQDMTWGVIGVLVGLVSGFIAVWKRTVGKSRLAKWLGEVETARDLALTDPAVGLGQLLRLRRRIADALRTGALDDAQLAVLEAHVLPAVRTARSRLLAPYREKLSPRFVDQFAQALEDALLSPAEAVELQVLLRAEERLAAGSRAQLDRLMSTAMSR